MKIQYKEINGCKLTTKCPFKFGQKIGRDTLIAMVGSDYCETKCVHFDSIDKENKIVFCKKTVSELVNQCPAAKE